MFLHMRHVCQLRAVGVHLMCHCFGYIIIVSAAADLHTLIK